MKRKGGIVDIQVKKKSIRHFIGEEQEKQQKNKTGRQTWLNLRVAGAPSISISLTNPPYIDANVHIKRNNDENVHNAKQSTSYTQTVGD